MGSNKDSLACYSYYLGIYAAQYCNVLYITVHITHDKQDEIKGANSDRADVEFAYRAMIYANNIYPFKAPYNSSKKTVKGADVAYFKSIKDDDYLVPDNNEAFKIRKNRFREKNYLYKNYIFNF